MMALDLTEPTLDDALLLSFNAEKARRHLGSFCETMDPFYERAAHSDLLCSELEAIDRGDNDRLIVMEPPRHSKTYHASERFPAWTMGRDPRQQLILASYAAELAWQNSRKARDLFAHPSWPFRAQLKDDSKAMNRWETTEGGILLAAGVGGAMTGFGADKLLIDDYCRNREDADSEVIREKQWQWFTSTARTRLMPGGAIVVTATHWHEDDLIGRILSSPGASRYRVIKLPAIAEDEHDPLGRPIGSALWPSWYDEAALAEIRTDIGSRDWWALYQQRPTASEGGMFKRDWFSTRYASTPATSFRVLAVDAAYKVGLSNDFSALVTVGVTPNGYAVLDVTYGRWEYPQLRQIIQDTAAREQVNAVLIEDSASGQSILQELRQSTRLAVLPVKVTASKEARATAIVPTCEAKRVQLPSQAAWLDAFIDQMAGFPTVAHDDIVDATVHALGYLAPFSGHGKVEEKRVTFGGVQDKKPQVPGDSRPKRRPQPASVSNWDMLERTIKDERSGRRTVSWR